VHEESRQTRLGKGFYETHRLQPEPIARTAEAVWEFARNRPRKKAASVRVIATSAARDAVNPADLTDAIERACGLKTEIISGAREAEWAFQGVATDPELAKQPLLLLDVGGGSTEFILGHGVKKSFAHSFPLGTVRLMEKFPHSDPPRKNPNSTPAATGCKIFCITKSVRSSNPPDKKCKPAKSVLVGTGGTTSILARIEKTGPLRPRKNRAHGLEF
jgi:exopolyphosphatase/guanosine-5'-triphosphate,3'-diphosphate pyrophosphatase